LSVEINSAKCISELSRGTMRN